MPYIAIEGPIITDLDKKRELVKEITQAAVKCYGLPEATIIIAIRGNSPENVGIGGSLLSDRQ